MRNTHFGDGGFGFHTSAKFKGMTNTAALIAAATSGPVAGAAVGSGQLRLALPVQQRGAAKVAVRLLREQLAATHTDLQGEALQAGTHT